jgi:ficolin
MVAKCLSKTVKLFSLKKYFCNSFTGNDKIHLLTASGRRYRLRFDLIDFDGNSRYAEYSAFVIGSSLEKYKLVTLGSYSGTAGESVCFC